jgi:ParB family chromosome partitioning protein
MPVVPAQRVEMIPIERITVVNPRIRNKRVFSEIVNNIAQIGLKRPITVTRRAEAGGPFYDLVCGQGRLEAYKQLGQAEVPALVVSANEEDCLVASLVENCARRQHQAIDLLQDIGAMKKRGHSVPEIARKTGLSAEYVYAVVRLLENGEERLLRAVETRQIPFSVAVEIADADDQGIQAALQKAYERRELRGKKLLAAKKLIEARRLRGKRLKSNKVARSEGYVRPMSAESIVHAYEEDVRKKRALINQAEVTHARLLFIVEAVRRLSRDQAFEKLIAEEALNTMPQCLADRLANGPSP